MVPPGPDPTVLLVRWATAKDGGGGGMTRWWTILLFLTLVGLPQHLSAATCTWTGLGGNDKWKTAGNWDQLPVAGDDLIFAGTTRPTPDNDFDVGTSFASITFAPLAGDFTLSGNRITLTGTLTNNSGRMQRVSLDITAAISWTPAMLGSSLAVWLDAADASTVTTSGGLVSQWRDKSGHGRNASQGDDLLKPTYVENAINGKQTMRFAPEGGAAKDKLKVSFSVTQNNLTVFVIAKKPSAGSATHEYSRLVSFRNTADDAQMIGDFGNTKGWAPAFFGRSVTFSGVAAPNVVTYRNWASITAQSLTYGVVHIVGSTINGSNVTLRLNGTETTGTTSATPMNADQMLIGGSAYETESEMYGDIAEVIVTTALSTTEQKTLEGYLAWKWGLSGNLPGNHDYKLQAPVPEALSIDTGSGGLAIGGVLSGPYGLTKTGTGTLTLTGAHTFTGTTTVSAGTLELGDGTTNGSVDASTGITNNTAVVFNVVGNQASNRVISGTGTVTKTGAGTLTLTGTHTYTGTTTISVGTLVLSGTASSSSFGISGGTLRGGGTCGALSLNSGGVAPGIVASTGTLSASGNTNLSAGGTMTVRVAGYATPGTDHDRLASTGTLTLGGSSALVVDLSGLASIGTASGIITCSGSPTGTFTTCTVVNNPSNYNVALNYTSGSVSVAVAAAGARTVYWNPLGSSSDGNQASNWTTDAAGTTRIVGLNATDILDFGGSGGNADNNCTLTGDLTCASLVGTGYTGTLNDGGYTLTVNGTTTFVAGMTLTTTGTLVIGATATLTTGGKSLKNLTANTGILTLGDACTVTGALTVGAALVLPNAVLTINSTAASTISGQISGGGASAGITKSGAGGSLTLSCANGNSYTGSTTVSGGSLLITNTSGSATSTGTVVVNSGGTLAGTGSVSGSVTVAAGGMLAPSGTSFGTGPLNLATTAAVSLGCGASGDRITITGDLTLDGSATISDAGGFGPGTYPLATYSGTLTDNRLDIASLPGANAAYVDTSVAGQVRLVVTAGANVAPGQVVTMLPIDCPDAGADSAIANDAVDTYGQVLNVRPRLILTVPSDNNGQPQHVKIWLDQTAGGTLVADSAKSSERGRFSWYNGTTWAALPDNGVPGGAPNLVRYQPTADLSSGQAGFWKAQTCDGMTDGTISTVHRFVVAAPAWTDDPLVAGNSRIRVVHVNELRRETNRTRIAYGLPVVSWTDDVLTANQTLIRAVHFTELHTGLTEVRSLTGTSVVIGAQTIAPGVAIRAAHITEMRTALGGL